MLARMGCLYCRLAIELPTQVRQLEAGDKGAAHGAAQGDNVLQSVRFASPPASVYATVASSC